MDLPVTKIPSIFNTHLRQVFMLGIIMALGVLLVAELYEFLPGLLGSITLYILTKKWYKKLTVDKQWHESLTAILFISVLILFIAVPLYFSAQWVIPKVNYLLNNQSKIISQLEIVSGKAEPYIGKEIFAPATAANIAKQFTSYIPLILDTTSNWIANFFMMFFFLFYFLYNNKYIENYIKTIIPLSETDIEELSTETTVMIKANALGIPILSIVHGIVACIGYAIFGVENWALWGFLTGVVAFFPILGILVVCVPLSVYYYSIDQNFTATGVALYSALVTGNVDYITRIGVMKKLGKVHPVIAVLGIIVGLKLFGFMGIIFGPLLVSYFIILIKFHTREFVASHGI